MSSRVHSSSSRTRSMGTASDVSDDMDLAQMVAHIATDEDLEDHLNHVLPSSIPSSSTLTRSPARAIPKSTAAAQHVSSSSSQPSSMGSSESGFIRGILDPGASGTGLLSHTPPTQFGTSYEVQHFGKRPRAGSISGRLRSASELEDKGIIDRQQKAILKDLIISGDEDLQAALDQYEQGNTSQLESMIRGGELSNRAAVDIDLLGDLDLDFLTVDDHFGGMAAEEAAASIPPVDARSAPLPMHAPSSSLPGKGSTSTSQIPPNMVSPSAYNDDGIGELEFDGDFFLPAAGNPVHASKVDSVAKVDTGTSNDQRFRSNSLAFGVLLNERPSAAEHEALYGNWMDVHPTREGIPSGIGASIAAYGRSKSESGLQLTKAQLAEEKRRLKLKKREQKEREKAEKKERRESLKREKMDREAREKQGRKEKKAASKAKQPVESDEEPKERPSGLGLPRSMSDPNLSCRIDSNGLLSVERPDGWVGAYSPDSRKIRIERFNAKRIHRVWTKKVKYDVRKNFADSRLRVKGRFVKKEDELLMRDLMSLT